MAPAFGVSKDSRQLVADLVRKQQRVPARDDVEQELTGESLGAFVRMNQGSRVEDTLTGEDDSPGGCSASPRQ